MLMERQDFGKSLSILLRTNLSILNANSYTDPDSQRIVNTVPQQLIQWESVDGLPNRGAIRFYNRGDSASIVKLSVAYKIPGILGKLMDDLFLGRIVESTLQADMERFRNYAVQAVQKS